MGVKGLSQLIKKYAGDVAQHIHISDLAFEKVAIDTSLFMFKYRVIFNDRWLTAFLNMVTSLRRNFVHPVFIFDSKAPADKDEEKRKRQEKRDKQEERLSRIEAAIHAFHETGVIDEVLMEVYKKVADERVVRLLGPAPSSDRFNISYVEEELERMKSKQVSISDQDFELLRTMLELMSVPCVQAPSEAEAYASFLCCTGRVAAVLSEDSDVLAYGCPRVLTKFDVGTGTCMLTNVNDIYRSLGLSYPSFVDLCIMCGTDYNPNMKGIGPEKAYKLVVQYGSLDAIEAAGYPVECLKYKRVRELFRFELDDKAIIKFCGMPQWQPLEVFAFRNNMRVNMGIIRKSFQPPELIFVDTPSEPPT